MTLNINLNITAEDIMEGGEEILRFVSMYDQLVHPEAFAGFEDILGDVSQVPQDEFEVEGSDLVHLGLDYFLEQLEQDLEDDIDQD